jgi:tripartite-type tricarboxylate transporter receptor subunit TctC
MPQVPTLAESGYPGYEDVTLNLLLAPAGTPKEIIQKLHFAVVKSLNQVELKKQFADKGIDLQSSPTPEDLGNLIKSEVVRLQKVALFAGIKPE